MGKLIQLHRGNAGVRVHPHRGGVDNGGSIGVAAQVLVVVLSGAGDNHRVCTQLFQNADHRPGSTPGAQHQHLFPFQRKAGALYHGRKAVVIGIVPPQAAVGPAENGVDGTDPAGGIRQVIQIGNHRLLVGNGHIDPGKIPVFQKIGNFFRFLFKERIGVISQHGMDLGGVAVPQSPAQQTAFHQTTSV